MQEVTTTDLYEAASYLSHGCELVAVNGHAFNNQFSCRLTVAGKNLSELQFAWFKGELEVNVLHFRRSYLHVVNYVNEARKKYKRSCSCSNETGTGGVTSFGGVTGGEA